MRMLTPLMWLLLSSAPHALSTPTTALAEQPAATKILTLEIRGMVTPNCPVLVKAAVGKMAGVEKVDASLKTKVVTIVYHPGRTSPDKIRKVIENQVGFDSKVVKG